ncbi:putative transposase [Escherichia coli P0298942.1]|nr:putative transposase [Escherichia coli P0298942.1]
MVDAIHEIINRSDVKKALIIPLSSKSKWWNSRIDQRSP